MNFDLAFTAWTIAPILSVAGTTVLITIASCIGAVALGFGFELGRRSRFGPGYAMQFVIDFIRSTPLLAWLYFLYYVLPYYGVVLPALVVGMLGLSIYFSGYLAEVFKAGIDSIPKGQGEAATALGMNDRDTMLLIIAPQMLRNVAAPIGNYFVSILKATPYLAVIAVPEMLGKALEIASSTYRYAEPLIVAGIAFLALALITAQLVHVLERRLRSPFTR
ncbi:amino acid ABC transporter permease [Mesorhizobium sp. IMUNJ 23232]|uniref:amino acid ABC transporter permease n=1 Tax=Mesorhizobium sp. IMUNJ 23232 TaxID=3376064 RepID=UPI0037B642DC